MRVITLERTGPPEVLRINERPVPEPGPGWVLLQVKAFGLNRIELLIRQNQTPYDIQLPIILGRECVGLVTDHDGTGPPKGSTAAAVMGGLGREYDGTYAEYVLAPREQVLPLDSTLPWEELAAIPEAGLMAWGALVDAMQAHAGQKLLVRGATSSVGMVAVAIAANLGLKVIATTRDKSKIEALQANGAHQVLMDTGDIAEQVQAVYSGGVDHVLDLVGPARLRDCLSAVSPRGIVCTMGTLGGKWFAQEFLPLDDIPSTVRLTTYSSRSVNSAASTEVLQHLVEAVEKGRLPLNLDCVFGFDEIVEAHSYMEENKAAGKVVVRV